MRNLLLPAVALFVVIIGCARGPVYIREADQKPIDRELVETPPGFALVEAVKNLTAPTAICFDNEGTMFIAENGADQNSPHIFARRTDGSTFTLYPPGPNIPILKLLKTGRAIFGPVGGMVVSNRRLYVTHKDASGNGGVTAFDYDGKMNTIFSDLPARGDYSVTDIAVRPSDGRIWFGVGAATNSGVVGPDNFAIGWVRRYPNFCDAPAVFLRLLGYRFSLKNPDGGLFQPETLTGGPFQRFGVGNQTKIGKAINDKPTAAIYSIDPAGGDPRIEAHGIRYPRGIAFNESSRPYATNQGMERRGIRPVKDDPDALVRIVSGTWYGWPDFSADCYPIYDMRFLPRREELINSGYEELNFLIDHERSNDPLKLNPPDRSLLLQGTLPPQAGASKLDFVPAAGPFREFHGSAVVALFGDRAPFATGGLKLDHPTGYKLVRINPDDKKVVDFVRNTKLDPASKLGRDVVALERPIDVKFGPDGAMYVVDFGRLRMSGADEKITKGSGKIWKLVKLDAPPSNVTTEIASCRRAQLCWACLRVG